MVYTHEVFWIHPKRYKPGLASLARNDGMLKDLILWLLLLNLRMSFPAF